MIEERLKKHLSLTEVAVEEEFSDEEEEEELPEITEEMEAVIKRAQGSRGETLIDKFQIAITRKDIETLRGEHSTKDRTAHKYLCKKNVSFFRCRSELAER